MIINLFYFKLPFLQYPPGCKGFPVYPEAQRSHLRPTYPSLHLHVGNPSVSR